MANRMEPEDHSPPAGKEINVMMAETDMLGLMIIGTGEPREHPVMEDVVQTDPETEPIQEEGVVLIDPEKETTELEDKQNRCDSHLSSNKT